MDTPRKISLITPIYNEARHLEEFLTKLDALTLPLAKELIFVNDASTDRSREILTSFPFKSDHKIFHHEKNAGKGAALQLGIQKATGDLVMIQDADFEYDLRDVPRLLQPFLQDEADIVYGSRFRKDGTQVHRTFHYLVNRVLTILSNMFSGLYLSDMETCYKVFRAEILQNVNLQSQRFGFEPEITAKIACLRVRVRELPISYYPRTYLQGKKITWKDGIAALWHLVYFNLLANKRAFFRDTLPQRFRAEGAQWL